MQCDDEKKDDGTIEAEFYAKQAVEWMRNCPVASRNRCPAAKLFKCIISQQEKIEQLEHNLKIEKDL